MIIFLFLISDIVSDEDPVCGQIWIQDSDTSNEGTFLNILN